MIREGHGSVSSPFHHFRLGVGERADGLLRYESRHLDDDEA
jgi:hypothetical protein